MIQIEKCHLCGYVTDKKLIHAEEGKIYCVPHYLLHILNDDLHPHIRISTNI